jgi:hypothetical protein
VFEKSPEKRAFFTISLYNVCGFPYDEVANQKAEVSIGDGPLPLFNRENQKGELWLNRHE